ncbi:hypothetical protein R6Q59_028709 [Mikania micrantha]
MATSNVFGKPITAGATRTDRAIQALNNPNADGKRDDALTYVTRLKQAWGYGVSTLGIFYNATVPIGATGSVGFAVYRVRVDDTEFCSQLIAWQTPWDQTRFNNQAYCDIFDDGKVEDPEEVYTKMNRLDSRQSVAIKKGMMVSSSIEQGSSPVYEAQFTREDAAASKRSLDQHDVGELSPSTSTIDKQDVVEASPSV